MITCFPYNTSCSIGNYIEILSVKHFYIIPSTTIKRVNSKLYNLKSQYFISHILFNFKLTNLKLYFIL